MAKALFVSQFEPNPVGDGGNHRAYQIVHDLQQIVGAEHVVQVVWPEWRQSAVDGPCEAGARATLRRVGPTARHIGRRIPPLRWAVRLWRKTGIRPWLRQVRQRLPYLVVEHPLDLLVGQGRASKRFASPEFSRYYRERVAGLAGTAVCVIEHPGFADVVRINRQLNIPTIACVQNLEAFDTATPLQIEQLRVIGLTVLDFVDEFSVLAQCDARLFISKVETGLIGGLGLPSYYYPYLPVGEVRAVMEAVRIRRQRGEITPGLFAMVGSAGHSTTAHAFRWFIQQISAHGLPEGARIIVSGSRTETLLPGEQMLPGLEFRGWIEQEVLETLLCRVQAMLVPQTLGFGALTRIPELSLAGVPVIMSQHPSYALDVLPGVRIVEDTWEAWAGAMSDSMHGKGQLQVTADYGDWQSMQINTLRLWVERLLCAQAKEKADALSDLE